jgi:hypothetical protein
LEVRCGFGLNLMQVICSNFLVERLQSAMVSLLSTRVVARQKKSISNPKFVEVWQFEP